MYVYYLHVFLFPALVKSRSGSSASLWSILSLGLLESRHPSARYDLGNDLSCWVSSWQASHEMENLSMMKRIALILPFSVFGSFS